MSIAEDIMRLLQMRGKRGLPDAPIRVFPTKHPKAKAYDGKGDSSNVVMMGVGLNGKEYVIPQMVGGKLLSEDEAINTAYRHGLSNYPSFDTPAAASAWASKNHGNIDAYGMMRPAPIAGIMAPLLAKYRKKKTPKDK